VNFLASVTLVTELAGRVIEEGASAGPLTREKVISELLVISKKILLSFW